MDPAKWVNPNLRPSCWNRGCMQKKQRGGVRQTLEEFKSGRAKVRWRIANILWEKHKWETTKWRHFLETWKDNKKSQVRNIAPFFPCTLGTHSVSPRENSPPFFMLQDVFIPWIKSSSWNKLWIFLKILQEKWRCNTVVTWHETSLTRGRNSCSPAKQVQVHESEKCSGSV